MSKNLNNFWDDCLDEQDLETNLFINSKNISSNRTKPSTSSKNNSEVIFISGAKYKSNNNLKKKINLRNSNPFNQKKQINRTKEFYEKWPFFKDLTTSFLNSIFWMKIEKLISFFPQYSTEGLLFFCIIYNIPSILNKTLY